MSTHGLTGYQNEEVDAFAATGVRAQLHVG